MPEKAPLKYQVKLQHNLLNKTPIKGYIMERYKLITNKSQTYPVYLVIDLITGQKVCKELSKSVAVEKQRDPEERHNV